MKKSSVGAAFQLYASLLLWHHIRSCYALRGSSLPLFLPAMAAQRSIFSSRLCVATPYLHTAEGCHDWQLLITSTSLSVSRWHQCFSLTFWLPFFPIVPWLWLQFPCLTSVHTTVGPNRLHGYAGYFALVKFNTLYIILETYQNFNFFCSHFRFVIIFLLKFYKNIYHLLVNPTWSPLTISILCMYYSISPLFFLHALLLF